jgi:hypothetical protein
MSTVRKPTVSRAGRAVLAAAVMLGAGAGFAPAGDAPVPVPAFCSTRPPVKFSAQRTRGIVRDAEVVVRATAIGRVPPPPGSNRPDGNYVSFAVREVLAGTPGSDTLVFMGALVDHDSFREPGGDRVPYLTFYRMYGGGDCTAGTYRPGAEYLLLLGRRENVRELDPYWRILAPTSEQVRGPDDRWVVWVRQTLAGG